MVSKASSRMGSAASIDYILSDKKLGAAKVLDRNGVVGKNGSEIMKEFAFIQQKNKRCVNNSISLIISPAPEDAEKLKDVQLRDILQKQLIHLGLVDHQYISTVHRSTEKYHIHAIINRVHPLTGKALNDSFLSKKAQEGAEKIALEMGLKTARQVQDEKRQITKKLKERVFQLIKTKKMNSWEAYIQGLRKAGISVEISKSKVSDQINGYKINGFKASDVDRKLTMSRIKSMLSVYNQQRNESPAIKRSGGRKM